MVKVIARMTGFYGGRVREIGDEFEVINEEWADEKTRPKWVELADGEGQAEVEPVAQAKPKMQAKAKA